MNNIIKSIFIILCFIFAGVISGILHVNAQPSVNSTTFVYHPCEEDECEQGGWMEDDECIDNPGNETYCPMSGSDCETKACGHTLEVN